MEAAAPEELATSSRERERVLNSRHYGNSDLAELKEGRINAALLRAHAGLLADITEAEKGPYHWIFIGAGEMDDAVIIDRVHEALGEGKARVVEVTLGSPTDGWCCLFLYRDGEGNLASYVVGQQKFANEKLIRHVCSLFELEPRASSTELTAGCSVDLLVYRERVVLWYPDEALFAGRWDAFLRRNVSADAPSRVRDFLLSAGRLLPSVPVVKKRQTRTARMGTNSSATSDSPSAREEMAKSMLIRMYTSALTNKTPELPPVQAPTNQQTLEELATTIGESGGMVQCVLCWKLQVHANLASAIQQQGAKSKKKKKKRKRGALPNPLQAQWENLPGVPFQWEAFRKKARVGRLYASYPGLHRQTILKAPGVWARNCGLPRCSWLVVISEFFKTRPDHSLTKFFRDKNGETRLVVMDVTGGVEEKEWPSSRPDEEIPEEEKEDLSGVDEDEETPDPEEDGQGSVPFLKRQRTATLSISDAVLDELDDWLSLLDDPAASATFDGLSSPPEQHATRAEDLVAFADGVNEHNPKRSMEKQPEGERAKKRAKEQAPRPGAVPKTLLRPLPEELCKRLQTVTTVEEQKSALGEMLGDPQEEWMAIELPADGGCMIHMFVRFLQLVHAKHRVMLVDCPPLYKDYQIDKDASKAHLDAFLRELAPVAKRIVKEMQGHWDAMLVSLAKETPAAPSAEAALCYLAREFGPSTHSDPGRRCYIVHRDEFKRLLGDGSVSIVQDIAQWARWQFFQALTADPQTSLLARLMLPLRPIATILSECFLSEGATSRGNVLRMGDLSLFKDARVLFKEVAGGNRGSPFDRLCRSWDQPALSFLFMGFQLLIPGLAVAQYRASDGQFGLCDEIPRYLLDGPLVPSEDGSTVTPVLHCWLPSVQVEDRLVGHWWLFFCFR